MASGKYVRTAETREKQRLAMLGKTISHEQRAKISKSLKGRRKGADNPYWKGGKSRKADGYILVLKRDHPNAMPNGYVLEHRLVMEAHIGRFLDRHEVVHHINGNKADNRIENLELTVQSAHVAGHNGPHSDETKARIGKANRAFYRSAEGREIQRKRAKEAFERERAAGIVRVNPMKGAIFTDEHREKIRMAAIGRKQSAETRAKKSEALRAAWARRRGET